MRKLWPLLAAVLSLGVGIAIGFFAANRSAGTESGTKPGSESGEPPITFRVGDPEVLLAAACLGYLEVSG